ncbi:MAG TPA: sugar ABC transporter permease [Thermoflexales bacterium]|nr:sugar ABC transporter permease [Thermoflexales bacterium]HQW35430.1 sugar ABC transporter permease [Thermoflexales bacterium]
MLTRGLNTFLRSRAGRLAVIALVILLALATRQRAVDLLPIDYDEDDYLRAAQQYQEAIRAGDWARLTELNYRPEHPPLAKLAFGLAIAHLPETDEILDRDTSAPPVNVLPYPHYKVARNLAAALGTAQVAVLALLNPLAAFFLALNTYNIKYTSQIMLEALPSLTSAVCALAYLRYRLTRRRGWLALSAIALGMTAASKYLYVVAGVAILADWLIWIWQNKTGRRRELLRVVMWGAAGVAVFFLCNPYLWPDPITRLQSSVFYHAGYADSEHVKEAGLTAGNVLARLFTPFIQRNVFLIALEPIVFLCALFGVAETWRKQRVMALWLAIGLAFLMAWPTKWPQYQLVLTLPLSVMAALGARGLWRLVAPSAQPAASKEKPTLRDTLRATPFLLPGLIALGVMALFPILYQLAMSLTDFNTSFGSFRDGLTGGVWREVVAGLTGQKDAVPFNPSFTRGFQRPDTVSYIALQGYLAVLGNGLVAALAPLNMLWAVVSVAGQTGLGVAVALTLNQRGLKFANVWRALFVIPWAVPEFVGGMVWQNLTNPKFGVLSSAPESLAQSLLSLFAAPLAAAWLGFPIIMLAASAGLSMISREALEAAQVDGATRWQTTRLVVLPMLTPLLAPAIIIRGILAFNQFYLFQAIDSPFYTLAAASYDVFQPSRQGLIGISSALNILIIAILFVMVGVFNKKTAT